MTATTISSATERSRLTGVRWLLWTAAFLLGASLFLHELNAVDQRANGFVVYYASARLLSEGADPAQFYDEEWFTNQVARFEPTVRDIYWANPPTMSLLLLPISGFSYHTARIIWLAFSFVLITTVALTLVTLLPLRGAWAPAFVAFAYLYEPLEDNLFHGQFYVLALTLLVVAFHGYRTQRTAQLGIPLGYLAATKTAALLMWVLVVVQRRWRTLAVGVACILLIALAALPLTGAASWARYAQEFVAVPKRSSLAVTAHQTVFSFFHHLLSGGPGIGDPILRAPKLATLLTGLAGFLLLAVTSWKAVQSDDDRAFAAFIVLGLMLTPVTGNPHWVMALLALGILLAEVPERGGTYLGILVIAALLLGAPVPYRSPRLANGWVALVAYPRLYGALLLWCLALWPGRSLKARSNQAQKPAESLATA